MPRTTTIRLIGDAIAAGEVTVTRLCGHEAIGELFAFDLELESQRDDWDLGELLRAPCRLEFAQGVLLPDSREAGVTMLPIHGVLAEVAQLHKRDEHFVYRARLVPAAWRLGLSYRSRTFLEQSLPDILQRVIEENGLPADAFELRLQGSYPTRPVVNQYQESDLDFIWRLIEHDGITAFFEHSDSGSLWVFCDHGQAFPPVPADPQLPYRPDGAGWNDDGLFSGSWFEPPTLQRLVCAQRPLTGKVILQDYQHEHPDLDLRAEADVEGQAIFGTRYEYGGNYDSQESGSTYATIRSQELACRERTFSGTTSSRALRAGATFQPADHFREAYNGELLLTSVEHRAQGGLDHMHYACSFEAVSREVPFRPQRRTPKPAIHGVLPAKVDAAGDGQYAEVDDQGNYRVKFPFDLSDAADGQASPPMRMGQAYGGAGMGMHFPLHKAVEVSVGFIHGDPDRPYISQSMPNPQNPSEISSSNQTGCVLRSGGANSIVLDDTDGSQRFDVNASYDRSLSVAHDNSESVGNNESLEVAVDRTVSVGSNQTVEVGADESWSVGGSQSLSVGADRQVTVGSNQQATVGADRSQTIASNDTLSVGSNRSETIGAADSRTVGSGDTQTIGADQSITVGGSATQNVAANLSLSVGASATINAAANYNLSAGGELLASAAKILLTAKGGIHLRVGASSIDITPAGIEISAPTVTIKASAVVDVKGGLVKNNA